MKTSLKTLRLFTVGVMATVVLSSCSYGTAKFLTRAATNEANNGNSDGAVGLLAIGAFGGIAYSLIWGGKK
jgi:hypothetical protein